ELSYYKTLIGHNMALIRRELPAHFGPAFPTDAVVAEVFGLLETRFLTEGVPLKPGLLELLTYISSAGYKAVLATSSDRQRVNGILAMTGLGGYFDDSVCGDEIKAGKPNPEIFLTACRKAGTPPRQALVLEDSEWGVLAAHAAGTACICVPDMVVPAPQIAEKANLVAETLSAVIPYLKQDRRAGSGLTAFHHVCVVAKEEAAALAFYTKGLGLEVMRTSYSENRHAKKLELALNGRYVLELFVPDQPAPAGFEHVSFLVRDLPCLLKTMRAGGCKTEGPKLDRATGKQYAFLYDPDGLKIELYEE
ncbi:MAG: HAD-IA family hydrolase, partial [Oscillospiraceae bacterium]|nr:HAD-IA family hydrolase [Oscillospiraceae bacterium]